MSSVHYFLHSLQHVNHTFNLVSHTFVSPQKYSEIFDVSTRNQYYQSIQMFFIVPVYIAAAYIGMYLLIVSIYLCYGKPRCIALDIKMYESNLQFSDDEEVLLKNRSNRKYKITLSRGAKRWRSVLAISAFILIAASIYCAVLLEHSTNIIAANIVSSYEPYHHNIVVGTDLNLSVHENGQTRSATHCELGGGLGLGVGVDGV